MAIVSIIMTSFNKPKFIGRAIEGILSQSFKDFELFLMDDNSNEETQKVIEKYLNDSRIKFFRSDVKSIDERVEKIRYAHLINQALLKAEGKYVSYATDDNIYHPDRLEKMVNYLEKNSEVNIVYSSSKITHIDENEEMVRSLIRPAQKVSWLAPCTIDHCSIMHRRDILDVIYEKWGSYWDENPEFYFIGDACFFWRLNHYWPFYPIEDVLDDNYITVESLHHKLAKEKENPLITKLPTQRTCRELRSSLREYLQKIQGDKK